MIAPPLPHLRIIAFKTGRAWSAWHLARKHFEPMCGAVVPQDAAHCEASRSSGPLILEDICKRCLAAYGQEE